MALKDLIADPNSTIERHRRQGRALLFWAAVIEDGEDISDEINRGIYQAIENGWMDCDDTGRRLSMTELGRARVETKFAEPS
jgi:hypothetical protein